MKDVRRRKISNKDAIHLRFNDECVYCHFPSAVIDHVLPTCAGGSNASSNLVACCVRCNLIAGGLVFDSFVDKRDYILSIRRPEILSSYRCA